MIPAEDVRGAVSGVLRANDDKHLSIETAIAKQLSLKPGKQTLTEIHKILVELCLDRYIDIERDPRVSGRLTAVMPRIQVPNTASAEKEHLHRQIQSLQEALVKARKDAEAALSLAAEQESSGASAEWETSTEAAEKISELEKRLEQREAELAKANDKALAAASRASNLQKKYDLLKAEEARLRALASEGKQRKIAKALASLELELQNCQAQRDALQEKIDRSRYLSCGCKAGVVDPSECEEGHNEEMTAYADPMIKLVPVRKAQS